MSLTMLRTGPVAHLGGGGLVAVLLLIAFSVCLVHATPVHAMAGHPGSGHATPGHDGTGETGEVAGHDLCGGVAAVEIAPGFDGLLVPVDAHALAAMPEPRAFCASAPDPPPKSSLSR